MSLHRGPASQMPSGTNDISRKMSTQRAFGRLDPYGGTSDIAWAMSIALDFYWRTFDIVQAMSFGLSMSFDIDIDIDIFLIP